MDPRTELLELSTAKWGWMSQKDVRQLGALFHPDATFVHMGATFTKAEELDVISGGRIHYRDFDIHDASATIADRTAVVRTSMQLGSTVDGQEVTNPFVVTETFTKADGKWLLLAMAFTRLVTH